MNIFLLCSIFIIILLVYHNNTENFTTSDEAIQNLSSMYNSDVLKTTKMIVSDEIITNKLNSQNITSSNITSDNIISNNIKMNGNIDYSEWDSNKKQCKWVDLKAVDENTLKKSNNSLFQSLPDTGKWGMYDTNQLVMCPSGMYLAGTKISQGREKSIGNFSGWCCKL